MAVEAKDKGFIEAALVRKVAVGRPAVPLPPDPADVAGFFQYLRQEGLRAVNVVLAAVDARHARAQMVPPRQQGGARRRADRRDIKGLVAQGARRERVEDRSGGIGVPVEAEVAGAKVVGKN